MVGRQYTEIRIAKHGKRNYNYSAGGEGKVGEVSGGEDGEEEEEIAQSWAIIQSHLAQY